MSTINLAQNGRSPWVVVQKHDALPVEEFAVKEFVSFFTQITGVTLPIVKDTAPVGAHEIILGRGLRSCLRKEGFDFATLGEDGYALYADEHQLYIAGATGRGTLNGVYSFLEDYLGCRWFTEKLSKIPQRSCPAISPIDKTFTPVFSYRRSANVDSDQWEFTVRNKINAKLRPDPRPEHGYEENYAIGFVHTFPSLIPEELYETHPEYFAMSESGERLHGHYTQRCLTNPDVLAITIEKVREAFRADPQAKIASVSQADTYPDAPNNCRCEACRAIDEIEGCPMGSVLRFVNAVADAVKDEFPDRYIDTLAYRYTRTAPKVTKPLDNVIVRLCSIECCFSHVLDRCSGAYKSQGIGRGG